MAERITIFSGTTADFSAVEAFYASCGYFQMSAADCVVISAKAEDKRLSEECAFRKKAARWSFFTDSGRTFLKEIGARPRGRARWAVLEIRQPCEHYPTRAGRYRHG
jgi:hypothetical protein